MKEKLTISDLTLITMLSHKTIRNYLRRGLLHGWQERGKWYFSPQEVNRFLEEPFVREAMDAKRRGIWEDFRQDTRKSHPAMFTALDYPAGEAEALELRARLLALVREQPVRMSYSFQSRTGQVRILLSGPREAVVWVLNRL